MGADTPSGGRSRTIVVLQWPSTRSDTGVTGGRNPIAFERWMPHEDAERHVAVSCPARATDFMAGSGTRCVMERAL
jgi:hypothetical protein